MKQNLIFDIKSKLTFGSRESAIIAKNNSREIFQTQPEVKVRFGREKSGSPSAAPPPNIKRALDPASNPFEDDEPTITSSITTGPRG